MMELEPRVLEPGALHGELHELGRHLLAGGLKVSHDVALRIGDKSEQKRGKN